MALIPYTVSMQFAPKNGSVMVSTPSEWRTRTRTNVPAHGKPTVMNLLAYISVFEESTKPGGANAHLGETKVTMAFIKDQRSGKVLTSVMR